MIQPGQAKEAIVAGPPESRRLQKLLGIERYLPPQGATKILCDLCKRKFWIGPTQKAFLEQYPDTPKSCFVCAMPHLQKTKGVISSGGAGGGYDLSDGTRLQPGYGQKN